MYDLEPGVFGDDDDLVLNLETDSDNYLTPHNLSSAAVDEDEFDGNEEYDGAILLEDDDEENDGESIGISRPLEGIFSNLNFPKTIKISTNYDKMIDDSYIFTFKIVVLIGNGVLIPDGRTDREFSVV